jgi:hypothetical protein
MKKMCLIAAICFAALLTIGCKKEKEATAKDYVGIWRGSSYIFYTMLFNLPDGSSKLYFKVKNGDTAQAGVKLYGTYTLDKGILRGEYEFAVSYERVSLETSKLSTNHMEGMVLFIESGDAFTFELKKIE